MGVKARAARNVVAVRRRSHGTIRRYHPGDLSSNVWNVGTEKINKTVVVGAGSLVLLITGVSP